MVVDLLLVWQPVAMLVRWAGDGSYSGWWLIDDGRYRSSQVEVEKVFAGDAECRLGVGLLALVFQLHAVLEEPF